MESNTNMYLENQGEQSEKRKSMKIGLHVEIANSKANESIDFTNYHVVIQWSTGETLN